MEPLLFLSEYEVTFNCSTLSGQAENILRTVEPQRRRSYDKGFSAHRQGITEPTEVSGAGSGQHHTSRHVFPSSSWLGKHIRRPLRNLDLDSEGLRPPQRSRRARAQI